MVCEKLYRNTLTTEKCCLLFKHREKPVYLEKKSPRAKARTYNSLTLVFRTDVVVQCKVIQERLGFWIPLPLEFPYKARYSD